MGLIINGEKIDDSKIQWEVERLRPDYEKVFKDQDAKEKESQLLDWSKENVIETVLLKQEAEKRIGRIPEDEVESLIARLKKQYGGEAEFYKEFNAADDEKAKEIITSALKLDRLFDDIYKDLPEPSKDAVRQYYEESGEQFKSAEQVRVGHIVKHVNWETDEAAAHNIIEKAQNELKNGAVFEMLVAEYSDCPENGGDLGYITRGQMVEEFEDVVFNLGIAEISGVFRTRFGFHIAKLYDRKLHDVHSLEEVKEGITDELKKRMQEKALDEFIDQLRSKAKIEEI
jgi:parvulin-like peptidyl-prolyl isomerase